MSQTTWGAGRRIAAYRLKRYLPGGAAWATRHSLPVVTGLILKAVFDRLSQNRPATSSALSLLAVFVAAEVVRAVVFYAAMTSWPAWFQAIGAWLRGNALESVLVAPGPPSERLPASPGEAISRFRDDVEDLQWFVDVWVDVAGGVIFTAVALAIMLTISPLVTLMVALPLVGVAIATRGLSHLIRRYHADLRQSGSAVTGIVADLFSGILTLKTAGADDRALDRFRARNAERRDAAVRAQLARDLLPAVSGMSVGIATGLVLLLSAAAMRDGRFTVGDLALFTTYADAMTDFPRWLGRMLAYHRLADVAMGRLARLQPGRRVEEVLTKRPVYLHSEPPLAAPPTREIEPFVSLEIRRLTAHHPSTGRGVTDVSLRVAAGSFTVIAGAVGSGKTTLLRATLGLIAPAHGEVLWNGQTLLDPGLELTPPRGAYVGQIPHLFSATLDENLTLGWPDDGAAHAVDVAQLASEIGEMPLGLQTVVGPRGSRLSGGQMQRAAVARALVRRPAVLVLDDVSSALDATTEEALWDALQQQGTTCLVAANRRPALRRADHIVVLDRGVVVASGDCDELLRSSPEFQRLWRTDPLSPGMKTPIS
jgi:ATP-binding cassette subfamily B protein